MRGGDAGAIPSRRPLLLHEPGWQEALRYQIFLDKHGSISNPSNPANLWASREYHSTKASRHTAAVQSVSPSSIKQGLVGEVGP